VSQLPAHQTTYSSVGLWARAGWMSVNPERFELWAKGTLPESLNRAWASLTASLRTDGRNMKRAKAIKSEATVLFEPCA
jgi:hypothetical protein